MYDRVSYMTLVNTHSICMCAHKQYGRCSCVETKCILCLRFVTLSFLVNNNWVTAGYKVKSGGEDYC